MDHFIGRETLKRGLSKYVAKYSYKNADLEEFVACLNEAQNEISSDSTLDLQKWTDSWLKTKGPSQISVEFLGGKLNIK
jgi:aminopeptidase N